MSYTSSSSSFSFSSSNFLISHFAEFIRFTEASIDGVLVWMNYVSFVSMNYACMVGWHYCNMYGWMHVCGTCYVWLMELCMYDEIICVGYLICLLWTCHVKNIYVSSICCENGWVYEKTEAMQALCRLPLTATGSLPSAVDGKEATWQPPVLPGSWPIWSVCLQWQTAKAWGSLPSATDGKDCR